MAGTTNLEHCWPAVQEVHVLSTDKLVTLFHSGLIEGGRTDFYGQRCNNLKINNAKYSIPESATSRSGIQFLGFNKDTVEEIWAYVNNPVFATPMVADTVSSRESEFWNRLHEWLNNRIRHIKETRHLNPTASSRDLLNLLGLQDTAQNWPYQLKILQIPGGLKCFSLVQVIESDVLRWAKRVITRKWNSLEDLEFTIFKGGNQINEWGWANVVEEFTQMPIDSEFAYVLDPKILPPTEELRLKER